MSNPKRVDAVAVHEALMGSEAHLGLFEQVLGFRTATTVIKAVHMMNDVAQTLLGGAPEHGGDFLCRLIREDKEGEPNSERELRTDSDFGEAFSRAFPDDLGPKKISALRSAADLVLNFDGGVYRAGDNMASALAPHRALLGFEGFRRFRLGAFLAQTLAPEGRERLAALFTSDQDPVSRAFRPLLLEAPLIDKQAAPRARELTAFDRALGARLSTLLAQDLSKPTLLRYFALAASLGVVLKVLGAGREGGRPVVLALAAEQDSPVRPLRAEAVQSFKRGVEALDRHLASLIPSHPLAEVLWKAPTRQGAPAVEVRAGVPLERAAEEVLQAMRRRGDEEPKTYWPDEFAVALGRKAGCVLPRHNKAGWGTHLALTPELVEILILMFVPRGTRAVEWSRLWKAVRDDLGLLVGSRPSLEAELLRQVGVHHVSLEKLLGNSELLLRQAVRRGVARRLPDSGAEAGGGLS